MRVNERADERMAQYLHPDYKLILTTVGWVRDRDALWFRTAWKWDYASGATELQDYGPRRLLKNCYKLQAEIPNVLKHIELKEKGIFYVNANSPRLILFISIYQCICISTPSLPDVH